MDVRTSFISVVDHLPAEIIRKLWLVQSLDIQYDTLEQELHTDLIKLQTLELSSNETTSLVRNINSIRDKLNTIRLESLAEAKSISSSIQLATLKLGNQHNQLKYDEKNYLNEIQLQNNFKRQNKRTSSLSKTITLKINLKNPKLTPMIKVNPKLKIKKPIKKNIIKIKKEPTYCYCNKESFGDMIACDNPKCVKEWFHYDCVGLKKPPRGKWFCDNCKPIPK